MSAKGYSDELHRALARPDANHLLRQIDAYVAYKARGGGDWPNASADDFAEIISCYHDDPDKALAYVVIAVSRSDDAGFLNYMGCGPLEDVLGERPVHSGCGRTTFVFPARQSAPVKRGRVQDRIGIRYRDFLVSAT